jgi:hypothetical protein
MLEEGETKYTELRTCSRRSVWLWAIFGFIIWPSVIPFGIMTDDGLTKYRSMYYLREKFDVNSEPLHLVDVVQNTANKSYSITGNSFTIIPLNL